MTPAHGAPPARATLELLPDRVIKTQPPPVAALEYQKSRLGAAIGAQSGLFSVPSIIDADLPRGRLVFARVDGLVPVRALLSEPGWARTCDRAAAVLVAIHAQLDLPPAIRRPVPPELDAPVPAAALHGDYSPTNLQCQPRTGRLWVLDWSAPTWLDQAATVGPVSIDLATFVLPLFWQRPAGPATVPSPEQRAGRFLDAYAQATGCDLAPVAAHAQRLQRVRLPGAAHLVSPIGLLLRLPMQLRCWTFLRRLARQRGARQQGGPAR